MIITDAKLKPYSLSLKSEWLTSCGQLSQRLGYILKLTTDNQYTGQGDCIPLHGTESLAQAHEHLTSLQPQLTNRSVKQLLNIDWATNQNPASCFALETALLDLQSKQLNLNIAQLLNPDAAHEVKVNMMIGHLDQTIFERAISAEQQGYRILKIKVGVYPATKELELISQLLSRLQSQTRLRLDANQAWTADQARSFVDGLARFADRIDSLEEPLQTSNIETLQQLQQTTAIELALDESLPMFLRQGTLDQLPVKRIIIKPARLGGLRNSFALAQQAEKLGITSIVTSSLESNIGLNASIQLAAAINNQQTHGLATASWFENNIGHSPNISSGRIIL